MRVHQRRRARGGCVRARLLRDGGDLPRAARADAGLLRAGSSTARSWQRDRADARGASLPMCSCRRQPRRPGISPGCGQRLRRFATASAAAVLIALGVAEVAARQWLQLLRRVRKSSNTPVRDVQLDDLRLRHVVEHLDHRAQAVAVRRHHHVAAGGEFGPMRLPQRQDAGQRPLRDSVPGSSADPGPRSARRGSGCRGSSVASGGGGMS